MKPTPATTPIDPFDADAHYNTRERELARLDPAWAKCAHALRADHRFGHRAGELRTSSLLTVWESLERQRGRFNRGNTLALLHAIAFCAEENVPLPTWLADAYRKAFERCMRPGGTSLDDAFRSEALPTATPRMAEAARRNWELGVQLYVAVGEVAPKHTSMDGALTEVLAKRRWGVGKTKARELIDLVEKAHCESTGCQRLSQFWSKSRKGFQRR